VYLVSSEQVASAVAVGERIGPEGFEAAGGFLLQALPNVDDGAMVKLQGQIEALPTLGDIVGEGPEAMLERLFGTDFEVVARYPAAMHCPCQRERFARLLVGLGVDELERLIAEQEVTETRCDFCGTVYTFDSEQMSALRYGATLKLK
jgi:molecular chaperone Hsp33